MSSVRAFLAVPLPPQIKAAVSALQRDLQSLMPPIRWSRPVNLHLTLQFFGATTQETLEKIKVSVLSVKHHRPPFMVEIKGLGAFPHWNRPRILWLGLEPEDQLRQLHSDLQSCLRQAGVLIAPQTYTPHLTIGRLQQHRCTLTDLSRKVGDCLIGQLRIDRLVLFESRLQPGGAEHIPLLTVTFDDEIGSL